MGIFASKSNPTQDHVSSGFFKPAKTESFFKPANKGPAVTPDIQRQPAAPTEEKSSGETVRPTIKDPKDFFNRMMNHPNYIDNHITEVNYFTAEVAIIHYSDGSSLRLGLVPRYMIPPIIEVDYHTPIDQFKPLYNPDQSVSFFRELDHANIPKNMPWGEVQRRYAQTVNFYADGKSGRIVPSRVNMLTAPTLCGVLLDSERRYLEQIKWGAEWGKQVAGVVLGMGGGNYGPAVKAIGTGARTVKGVPAGKQATGEAGERIVSSNAGKGTKEAAEKVTTTTAKKIPSDEIGETIIGWGRGQTAEAVIKTQQVTKALTENKVKEMISKGLTKEWVEEQLKRYTAAIAKGQKKLRNNQLFVRQELMERILSLWPKG